MPTAALAPNATSAYIWNTPNISQKFQPINYTVENTVERVTINTNSNSLNSVKEILSDITKFTDIGLEQVKLNYKLAKKYIKYVNSIKQMCLSIIEAVEGIVQLNNLQIKDANMINFMDIINKAYAESDYAYETLMLFKTLDECEKLSGNTYTLSQLKKKFNIV